MPPQLKSSRDRDTYREALANAAADARANAEQLATSLGAKLGDAITISAGSAPRPPVPVMRATAAMADMQESAPATYNAADLNFRATVNVVFELID